MSLRPTFTAREVAEQLRCSERALRSLARRLGACHVLGKAMWFTEADILAIQEATRPCPSPSSSAATSGTTAAPLPTGGYEDLRRLRTKSSRSASRPTSRPGTGKVVSMVPARS